jgi:uncharacterized protein
MTTIEGALKPNPAGGWFCRSGCGACCVALSISSPIPGMPEGKPAGVRCVQLSASNLCMIFGKPERPEVCARLRPEPQMCGNSRAGAIASIALLEAATRPELSRQ